MKHKSLFYLAAFPAVLFSLAGQAHEPNKHMKDGEKPDCAPIKDMDRANMDMKDPVMQAMMQKCMEQMHHDKAGSDDAHGKQDEKDETNKPSKHEHKK